MACAHEAALAGSAIAREIVDVDDVDQAPGKAQELRAFVLLAVVMAPVLAGAVVAGWGFVVWMFQLS